MRNRLGSLVRRAFHARERITVTDHGRPVAVPIDPQEPADLEDTLDLTRYRRRQATDRTAGVPHGQVRTRLGPAWASRPTPTVRASPAVNAARRLTGGPEDLRQLMDAIDLLAYQSRPRHHHLRITGPAPEVRGPPPTPRRPGRHRRPDVGQQRSAHPPRCTVVVIERPGEDFAYATADTVEEGDTIVVAGRTRQTERFSELG